MTLIKATFLILFVNLAIASPIPQINESWININDFEVNFDDDLEDGLRYKVNIKHNDIYNVWKVEQLEGSLQLRGWYNKTIDFILSLDIPVFSMGAGKGALPAVMKDDKKLSGCALKSCAG